MKPVERSPGLRRFSRDEHRWLAWARELARAASSGAADADLARSAAARFAAELAPHMAAEERHLLPLLEQAGEREPAERTRAEHAALRALAARLAHGEVAVLAKFAAALRAHIHYEELELWAAAERALSTEQLAALARGAPEERGSHGEGDGEPE